MKVAYRSNTGASRRRAAITLLAVIAIHLALYGWLRSSGGWRMRHDAPAEPARLTLRLLPWIEPPMPAPAAEPKAGYAPPRTRGAFDAISATRAPQPPLAGRDQAPAPNASQPTLQADTGFAPSPPASQASQPQPQPPLNLALPPGYSRRIDARNPALDDGRANTARTTPEQRLAGALDTRLVEEDLGDARRRFRQGDKCVIVQQSRIGQLMPFNDAAVRSPSLVGACP